MYDTFMSTYLIIIHKLSLCKLKNLNTFQNIILLISIVNLKKNGI